MKKPTVVDLFAGAGLLSSAFKAEGFQLVRAIELDRVAAGTYELNLGGAVQVADVRTLDAGPRADALIAGPPCQGFSTLGTRNPRDPRNLLSLEVVRWTANVKPRVVVVENVEAFLYSRVWRRLKNELEKLGFEVLAFVFEAHDFGVPQLRRRSFTIATRVGLHRIRSIGGRAPKSVREAWRGLPPIPDGRRNHYAPEPSPIALSRMKLIPEGGDKRDVMRVAPHLTAKSWWEVRCQATDVWGRMRWGQPANTLRTALQNASKGRYIHPEQHRVISLREAARLHSVPDSWEFMGTPYQVARQIGNGVPPRLGRAVARSVRKSLT